MRDIWYHRRSAFRDLIKTRAADRVADIPHQEITRELIVINRHHRARFAHPGINGKRHLIVIAPRNVVHRAAGLAGKINKSAPAGLPFHQRKAAFDRLAFQTRHGEGPALGAVGVGNHVHAV